ncbi:MAG: Blue-light-activated protein [Planctomycetaceae bacterium]|nr:Blue-light-activated protein [Planctomycetaceae bacterium]
MSTPLRVLILEDNPSDAEALLHALRRAGYDPITTWAETEQDYRAHLQLLPEIILADFSMPEFDALRALEIMQECQVDIPFIIVSGTIGEERAVEVMQRGATDYLLKDRMGRLGQAVAQGIERKVNEQALRQSQERIKELTANVHQVLWTIDARESKILYISPGYEEMWGRSCQSLLDNPHCYLEGVHPLDQEMMRREDAAMYSTGHIDVEFRVLRPDGSVRWVWIRGNPVTEQDQIVRLVGVIEDITKQRQLSVERDALLSRLQLHIERMPLGYALSDADFRIIGWNPTAERIFGFMQVEVLGKHPSECIVPPQSQSLVTDIFTRLAAGDMYANGTSENVTKDGRTIICEWHNTPLFGPDGVFQGILSLAQDVTERKTLEEQLHQAQKMEAIGQLAGGIAHDFNNLLTIINGYSEIILTEILENRTVQDFAGEIRQAGERAAALTRQLLAFSRKQVLDPRLLSLNTIVTDTEGMLRRLIGEDIVVSAVLAPALGRVKADPGQIEQVILNLAINARDAMPQGGNLTIETANTELDETYTQTYSDVRPGRYVMLAVTDTGTGMDKATKVRIFEPFFTTKEPGKGTGLGLATVFGIVKQSGGHIAVYSEPGHGTTFKVYLPAVDEITAATPSPSPLKPDLNGTETIILTEDEPALRAVASRILQMRGYTVMEASQGPDALRIAEEYKGTIDLLLTDVVMPAMSGRQLAKGIAASRPFIKVLYMSGYTDDAVVRHGVLEAETAFIQKPFTPNALALKVRDVLDNSWPHGVKLTAAGKENKTRHA